MKLLWSFLCLAFFLSACAPLAAAQGGLKMRITKKGIDYANTVAQALIQEKLRTIMIPDFTFSAKRLSGSISNIRTNGIVGPSSSLSLHPGHNGLTWSLTRFSVNLNADWRASYKVGWFNISDHGRIEFSASGVSITTTIGIGTSDGRPTLQLKHCSADLGDVQVSFHGGLALIYNLFKRPAARKAKEELTPEICEQVSKAVNENAREALARMKVTADIDHRFLVDYGLMGPVSVTSQHMESQHKGEVTWKSDQRRSPYFPPQFPASGDTNRMLYLWLSEYTVDTFVYTAHRHGYLQYYLTKADLGQKYPNSWVSIGIRSAAEPQITMTSGAISVMAVANVDLDVNMPNGTTANILRLNVSLSLSGHLAIANDLLKARVIRHSFTINVVSSSIGNATALEAGLQTLISGTLQFSIIPELNRRGQMGVELPMSDDVLIKNAKFSLHRGFVVVSSDVDYTKV